MSLGKSLVLPAVAGGVGGTAAALLVLFRLLTKREIPEPDPSAPIDDFIAFDIMETARAYAEDVGRPEVANLVARRVLLAQRLSGRGAA